MIIFLKIVNCNLLTIQSKRVKRQIKLTGDSQSSMGNKRDFVRVICAPQSSLHVIGIMTDSSIIKYPTFLQSLGREKEERRDEHP